MTEEDVSVGLFIAATADSGVDVLSWQSVDGKNYFAFDIKLRLPTNERLEPDLVLRSETLWLIEVKGTHSEAVDDEAKLARLLDELGAAELRAQIYRRAGILEPDDMPIELAIAFGKDDLGTDARCEPRVLHIAWMEAQSPVEQKGLGAFLASLSSSGTEARGPG
jgi:hypothetical protein